MRPILAILILCSFVACGDGAKDSTSTSGTHQPAVPTEGCENYVKGTSVKGDYLCSHNGVRAAVKPAPASPMPALTWNENLAKVAQAWADTCTWDHNPDRTRQYDALSGDNTYVGENLYLSSAPTVSPYDAVEAWAGESKFYDYASNSCASGEMCGHYTQLVWAETHQVGCGSASCASVGGSTLTNATIIVCDYAPGGNIVGQKPY